MSLLQKINEKFGYIQNIVKVVVPVILLSFAFIQGKPALFDFFIGDSPVVILKHVEIGDGTPGESVPLRIRVDYLRNCRITAFDIRAVDSSGKFWRIKNNRIDTQITIGKNQNVEFDAEIPLRAAEGKLKITEVNAAHFCGRGDPIPAKALDVGSSWVYPTGS